MELVANSVFTTSDGKKHFPSEVFTVPEKEAAELIKIGYAVTAEDKIQAKPRKSKKC